MTFTKEEARILEMFFFHKEKEQYKEALASLDALLPTHENNSIIQGLYGTVFYELEDYENCIKSFRKVLVSNPRSELASLTMFSSFIKVGKPQRALNELFRYTEIAAPKLYIITIKELMETDNDLDNTNRAKLKKLYDKWCV